MFFQIQILTDNSPRSEISFDNCNNILSDDSFTLIENIRLKYKFEKDMFGYEQEWLQNKVIGLFIAVSGSLPREEYILWGQSFKSIYSPDDLDGTIDFLLATWSVKPRGS